ncbi:hypothetical protein BH09BAC1_BH09BAC1_17690 [soil metagenome]
MLWWEVHKVLNVYAFDLLSTRIQGDYKLKRSRHCESLTILQYEKYLSQA